MVWCTSPPASGFSVCRHVLCKAPRKHMLSAVVLRRLRTCATHRQLLARAPLAPNRLMNASNFTRRSHLPQWCLEGSDAAAVRLLEPLAAVEHLSFVGSRSLSSAAFAGLQRLAASPARGRLRSLNAKNIGEASFSSVSWLRFQWLPLEVHCLKWLMTPMNRLDDQRCRQSGATRC